MTTGTKGCRAAGVAAVVVALVVPAGCGGDDGPSADEEARAAAQEFTASLEGGDYSAACEELTDELRAQLGGEGCPDQLAAVAGEGSGVSITVTNVRVSGPKAVAETQVVREGTPPRESSFELVEAEGAWLVSKFGD
jgi:hypothetical protein